MGQETPEPCHGPATAGRCSKVQQNGEKGKNEPSGFPWQLVFFVSYPPVTDRWMTPPIRPISTERDLLAGSNCILTCFVATGSRYGDGGSRLGRLVSGMRAHPLRECGCRRWRQPLDDSIISFEGKGEFMQSKVLSIAVLAGFITACAATPRTADNITLARTAKDYIGVASIDEMEITNVQKIPVEGSNLLGETHYRYFVDTAHKKKFVCDVVLWGLKTDGTPFKPDGVKCEAR